MQENNIISINGVEALDQPPNCINDEPIVIIRNSTAEHYDAMTLHSKLTWTNISKAMITKDISSIDKSMLHNLCPDDIAPTNTDEKLLNSKQQEQETEERSMPKLNKKQVLTPPPGPCMALRPLKVTSELVQTLCMINGQK